VQQSAVHIENYEINKDVYKLQERFDKVKDLKRTSHQDVKGNTTIIIIFEHICKY